MELDAQIEQALMQVGSASSLDVLESLRVALLGKSGLVTEQLKALGKLAPDERKAQGALVNRAKEHLQDAIAQRKSVLENAAFDARLASEEIDITLPGRNADLGSIQPVTRTLERIIDIFSRLGYTQADGPRSRTTTIISRR